MLASYVAVTVVAAAFNGLTAIANLVGHEYPKRQDAAARGAHALFQDREADQARELLDQLAALGRSARSHERTR